MPYPESAQRKGGEVTRKHGVHAIEERGEDAMTAEQRQTLTEVRASLETPEGIVEALRERVAMGVTIMGVLEAYVKAELDAGKSLDQIAVFKGWPAYQNSAVRALKLLLETLPSDKDRAGYAELVNEMSERVDKASAGEEEQQKQEQGQRQEEQEPE